MRAEASFLMAAFAASPVAAGCVCACDDGRIRAVCESAAEVPPVCPPRACAIEPPSVVPLPGTTIRPLGRARCAPTQVYSEASGKYEWVRLCN